MVTGTDPIDMTARVDPEIARLAPYLVGEPPSPEHADLLPRASGTVPYAQEPPSGVTREARTIPGAPNVPDLEIRVFRPTSVTAPVPGFLWIHGGGYVAGAH